MIGSNSRLTHIHILRVHLAANHCTTPLTTAPRGLIPYSVYSVQYNLTIYFSVRLLSVLRGHSVFSSPPQWPMTSDVEGFSIPDFIHYIYFPILILEKEPVFPFLMFFVFWMFSAKQGHNWYHFYNVFGMTRYLTGDLTRDLQHSKPALTTRLSSWQYIVNCL